MMALMQMISVRTHVYGEYVKKTQRKEVIGGAVLGLGALATDISAKGRID